MASRLGLALVWLLLFVGLAAAQAPQRGDPVEVKLGDNIVPAEFVSQSPVGVRVKLADGTMKLVPATQVRRPQGGAKPAGAAATATPATGAAAPANPAPAAGDVSGLRGRREWTDATGQFKIEAEYLKLEGENLQLKRADGKVVTLPLSKLSAADREIAKSLGAAKASDNPFEAHVSDAPASGAANEAQAVNYQAAPALVLNPPAAWGLKYELAPAAPAVPDRSVAIPRAPIGGNGGDFFEEAKRFLYLPQLNQFWIAFRNAPPGKEPVSRLERIEMPSGRALPSLRLESASVIADVDPAGKLAVAIDEKDFQTRHQRLDLFSIADEGFKLLKSFKPYVTPSGKNNSFEAQVTEARFLDDKHLLTVSNQHKLVVWNLETLQPIYRIEQDHTSHRIALSPSRKQLLVGEKSSVMALDALTGQVLGQLEAPASDFPLGGRLFFRPDAAEAALLQTTHLHRWDLTTGKLIKSEQLYRGGVGSGLGWLPGNLMLFDHNTVYDLERQLPVCFLGGAKQAEVLGGKACFLVEQHQGGGKFFGIVPLALPTAEMTTKLAQVNEEELLSIKPGEKIRLSLNLPFEPAMNDQVRESLTRTLQANGWVVDDNAEIVLSAEVTAGETREISYRTFRFFETTKVSVTYQHGKLTLKRGEDTLWNQQTTWGPPHFISLKEGETIEQATAVKPRPEFFSGARIPKRLLKLPTGFLLRANLTPTGLSFF